MNPRLITHTLHSQTISGAKRFDGATSGLLGIICSALVVAAAAAAAGEKRQIKASLPIKRKLRASHFLEAQRRNQPEVVIKGRKNSENSASCTLSRIDM